MMMEFLISKDLYSNFDFIMKKWPKLYVQTKKLCHYCSIMCVYVCVFVYLCIM